VGVPSGSPKDKRHQAAEAEKIIDEIKKRK
jgi:hypothetical protein